MELTHPISPNLNTTTKQTGPVRRQDARGLRRHGGEAVADGPGHRLRGRLRPRHEGRT